MVEKLFFYHTWASRSVITLCHLIVNIKLQPNILRLANLPSFLAKDLFFVIAHGMLQFCWLAFLCLLFTSWSAFLKLLFSSFLIKVTSPSFSLIKKWNYNIWILNHVILIFMNGMLKYLNISLVTWPESQMTREIQPVKSSPNSYTHNPYIKSHKNTRKWFNIITIKFDTKLKPTKNIVVNHNLQNSWL